MPSNISFKARFFITLARNRHLLKFQQKEHWDFNTSVQKFRDECEAGAKKMGNIPEGIEVMPLTFAGLPAEWITPKGAKRDRVIFHIHGGGYIAGSCSDHRNYVAKLAEGTGFPVLLFEYRLAPEHPFPAGFDDTMAAYAELLAQGTDPRHVVFTGDSAGAGMCLAALLAIRDRGLPLPAAAAVVSPWTDLKLTGASYRTKAQVCLSPLGMSEVCSKYYAGENDPALPYISPLYGDLHGLPPLLLFAGGDETLRDDSIAFAAKARSAGVDVTLRIGEGMTHCYPFYAPLFFEATQAMGELCAFIKKKI
jgi:epsilon-lactone hydrolase